MYRHSPMSPRTPGPYEPFTPDSQRSFRGPQYISAPRSHGPLIRTFNVLLTDATGNRWYEREVTCSRASDLMGILQSRIGIPVKEVLYQGQVFTDAHLAHVPDDLKLTLGTYVPGLSTSPTKTVTLLVEDTPKRITVEASSVPDLQHKLAELGVSGSLLSKIPGTDQYEPLNNLDDLGYEHTVRVVPDHGGSTNNLLQPQQYIPRGAPHTPTSPRVHRAHEPIGIQAVMVEAGHLLMQEMPKAEDEVIAAATARVTQYFRQMYNTAEAGRDLNESEMAHLRHLVNRQLPEHAGPVPNEHEVSGGQSVFKAVTFGIAGAFPALEVGTEDIALTPPAQTVTGQSVIVLVHARVEKPMDIRCTLGYENEESKVIVINLDEFYVNGWITIGKTSPVSLFLSFQPDVLRAGVRYFMDITAFAANNPAHRLGAAQTEFTMREAGTYPIPQHQQRQRPPRQDGYFQRQLRNFVDTTILPLYSLSTNPRFTEQTFRRMVDEACGDFWSFPPDQELQEIHKKTILGRVKYWLMSH
eukprot:TRINITY_DN7950_c0_g1_i2.p1 TRINITY_DN7950_c0_g1~~TRINITY_DN7950_c0_g1_i2.p1  ORF type:complete len:526 (+),score=167.71 TRINITY_DN7950_c0_g1_i2:479-2056(+)